MMTRMNCERVEVLLNARLDGTLEQDERQEMDAHIASCADCRALVSDIERIVADARVLPVLTPSHDLWSAIAAQLGEQDVADVVVDDGVQSLDDWRKIRAMQRSLPWRTMAAAAVLLIAVTAAVTWNLARFGADPANLPVVATTETRPSTETRSPAADSQPAGSDIANSRVVSPAVGRNSEVPRNTQATTAYVDLGELERAELAARYAASVDGDVDAIYEREIRALRTIVDERFAELDSTTVSELQRNIAIIDKAIADSREALRRDPRSRLLTKQLDRALGHKLDLLRRVALL